MTVGLTAYAHESLRGLSVVVVLEGSSLGMRM